MFYEGSVRDGISHAVGLQKLVVCFVTDGNEESTQWEEDFLKDPSIQDLIAQQAVALRLIAGSDDAQYLAQVFPLPKTPTVVIIKNGELKDYITSGTSKEDFVRRFHGACNVTPKPPTTSSPPSAQTSSPSQVDASSNQIAVPVAAPVSEQSESVRRVLAERAAKLKAQKEEAERRQREDRAMAKEKARADAEAGADTDAARAHQQAEAVKKRRQQEQEERRRILKRIEDDKEERRMRAAERERQRIDNQSTGDVAAALVSAPESKMPSTTRIGDMTALQVRVFDGSTIRSRFKTASTLRDVRKWVDENRTDGSAPYKFKQVLMPLPNKDIDDTEEEKELAELGLAPSSTLVLVPVRIYAAAYDGGSGNVFLRFLALIASFFSWILSLVGLGGRAGAHQEPSVSQAAQQQPAGRGRVHGMNDADGRRRDQQLYNGNSLNFEPRPEDDEK